LLELQNLSKKVGSSTHINDVSLTLEKGSLYVLLGATLSGKTSLMRLMAGLDKPTSGEILMNGQSVLKTPVQKRNIAMVYQQFINYPGFTVYENIASPLRVAGVNKKAIDIQVREAADLMKLTPYLDRGVLNLSGGQQQRTALARALVKGAELVLLDEPLANLDYKLREELRIELPRIFAEAGAIFVYATTEPQEALLLGGRTVTLREGSVTQFGKTIDVYNNPTNLETAQTFSDPPMNVIPMQKRGVDFTFSDGQVSCPKDLLGLPDGAYNIGIRPHHLMLNQSEATTLKIQAPVSSTEISGSETFIHVSQDDLKLVVLTHGVHRVGIGDHIDIYLDPSKFFIFDQHDALVSAPNVGIA
jgi:glycerol transport system ATP-binding protein|tara:strand:- start:18636 stop:19715 length:1080 start_codon:yes stop_codon:yes gene_type:complete